jgi:hypothetical protein
MATLQQALQAVATDLAHFAAKDDFGSLFAGIFGGNAGRAAVHGIQNQLLRGEPSRLARVEVISGAQLGAANAAYASASNTIYLSDRFLAQATLAELRAVLLEEFGHAIDARVNLSDRPGDEGELFSLLVRGLTPTVSERQRILAEDDRRTLTINGSQVAVEQAAPVVYETTTIWRGSGSSSYSYEISGINALIETSNGRARNQLILFDGSNSRTIANSIYDSFGDIGISGTSAAYIKSNGQASDDRQDVYRFSGGITSKLTNNSSRIDDLLIDGSTITWTDYGAAPGGDLYRSNGLTTTRITNNTVKERDIQLSSNILAWSAYDGNDYEIYVNDGSKTINLTNNSVDDYSPVLSSTRLAWLQLDNNQENLFFYDGKTTRQVTSNLEVSGPLIAGNNLVYLQHESNGGISLKLFNTKTLATRTLSSNLYDGSDVKASSNLVAWREKNDSDNYSATLKLFNGSKIITIANDIWQYGRNTFALRNNKLIYSRPIQTRLQTNNELFVYDANNVSETSTQLTIGENIGSFRKVDVDGERVIWVDDYTMLKLTQPSTKAYLSFENRGISVVEGLTTPQTASLTVKLSTATITPVSVRWETYSRYADGENEADSGSDYRSSSGDLTFAPGELTKTISIPIVNDSWNEPDERFYVQLTNPSNAILVPGETAAAITISDTWEAKDPFPSKTITLPDSVENLTLANEPMIAVTVKGNNNDNIITINDGFNMILDGLFGTDTISCAPSPNAVTVSLAVDGSEFINGWGNHQIRNFEDIIGSGFNDTITGGFRANQIRGGAGKDTLTGGGGPDTFDYTALEDSLISKGCDKITDFDARDKTGTQVDRFLISNPLSVFITAGDISRFTAAEIKKILPPSTFVANSAASFRFGFGRFVAINDAIAGFDQDKDALIEVTGLKGTIDASHFVTS